MNTSVHHSEEICKRLSENNLLESVKAVSEPYIISIMMSMYQAGYHGKQSIWRATATGTEPVFPVSYAGNLSVMMNSLQPRNSAL